MSFTRKPGTGALFKNDKKSKDTQPDYKGSLTLPDGSTVQIGGWISQGANGKYLSLKVGNLLPPAGDVEDLNNSTPQSPSHSPPGPGNSR